MGTLAGTGSQGWKMLQTAALVLLAPGIALAFVAVGRPFLSLPSVGLVGVGVLAGLLVGHWVSRHLPMLDTFEHELTHTLAAMLFLCVPTEFVVNRRGGYVRHRSSLIPLLNPFAELFISLAPYVVPTYTVLLVLARPWIGESWQAAFDAVIGLSFGYHVTTTFRETVGAVRSPALESVGGVAAWSDIAKVGFFHAAVYVPVVTLAVHGLLLAGLVAGWQGLRFWGTTVLGTTGQVVDYLGGRVFGGLL